jgi:hypothetical protein
MMTHLTGVEAIEFFREHKRYIHVYYQFQDERVIRESCLVEDSGWFVRGDGIVATTARAKSPITVTRWTEDESSPTKVGRICLFCSRIGIVDHNSMSRLWCST